MRLEKLTLVLSPYALSLAATVVALICSLAFFAWFGQSLAFAFFLPAIMVSAWYGGFKSGLVCDILSVIAMYYFFTPPYNSIDVKSTISIMQLLLFIIEGFVVSYFIDGGHQYEKILVYKKREQEDKRTIEDLKKNLIAAKKDTALRDEFLAIASHELKTPLTTVVLQIQTTLHNIRNVSLSEFSVEHLLHMLQSMQNQTRRLSKMINDLLNISLITTHKMELEREDVDLATHINDIIEGFAEKLQKEGITLTLHVKDSVVGKWDKLRLEQVIDNLISNAIKYGNKKPIRIEIEKEKNKAIIRVVDNGIGIHPSEKEQIFSLFKRGSIEKDYKGLGIGLYITNQIVELHGGRIDVKSHLGHGTTFSISLPLTVK